jgi:hypothetical protein
MNCHTVRIHFAMYTIIYTAVDIKFLHPDHFNYNNEINNKIYEYFLPL